MKKKYFEKKLSNLSSIDYNDKVSKIPNNALIELTNGCNHSCIFCYNPEMKRKIDHLDFETYKEFLKNAVNEGLEEVGLYSTGEPFMTKNLDKFIFEAKKNGIKRVYITTNGSLASFDKVKKCLDAGLDSIKFSINAGSRETYKLIHGQDDFQKVIKNLDDIYNYKKKNKLNLMILCSFVYTDLTKSEIKIFEKKYKKYFEDILFVEAENQGGRTGEKISELVKTDKIDKSKSYKPCGMIWNRLHLTNEGYLTACCVDYENHLAFQKYDPNISVIDQFNNSKIRDLRKKHLENKLDGTICKNCIYNTNDEYDFIDKEITKNIKLKSHKIVDRKISNINNRIVEHKKNTKLI